MTQRKTIHIGDTFTDSRMGVSWTLKRLDDDPNGYPRIRALAFSHDPNYPIHDFTTEAEWFNQRGFIMAANA